MGTRIYQDLEAEIQRFTAEIQQLRNRDDIGLKELSSCWFQLINHSKLSIHHYSQHRPNHIKQYY
jgi:hypothetical protein